MALSNNIIAYDNAVDDSDVFSSITGSFASAFSSVSIQEAFKRLNVGATNTATMTVAFSQDITLAAFSLQFARGTYPGVSETSPAVGSSATVQVILKDSSGSTVATYSETGTVVAGYQGFAVETSGQTIRSVEVNITDPDRPDGYYIDIEHIGAWRRSVTPSINAAYPAGFGWAAQKRRSVNPAGRESNTRFDPLRKWNIEYDFLTKDSTLEMSEMIRFIGGSLLALVSRNDLPAGKNFMIGIVTQTRDAEFRTSTHLRQALNVSEQF